MPELPEVESIRRSLEILVPGQKIEGIELIWPGAVEGWKEKSFGDLVLGRTIETIGRKGKYLLIGLDEGITVVGHMRMTGRLLYYPCHGKDEQTFGRHTHVVLKLSLGELHFNDQRKFGRLSVVPTDSLSLYPPLAKLGPEPMDKDLDGSTLEHKLRNRKVSLKAALLDQTVVAGLGNIYADEVMFEAGIEPERLVCHLGSTEMERLCQSMRNVIEAAIEAKGTTFRDYRDAYGGSGAFQNRLKVYGRAGKPCVQCGTPLLKMRLAGRTTVWCPHCQK